MRKDGGPINAEQQQEQRILMRQEVQEPKPHLIDNSAKTWSIKVTHFPQLTQQIYPSWKSTTRPQQDPGHAQACQPMMRSSSINCCIGHTEAGARCALRQEEGKMDISESINAQSQKQIR